MDSEIKRDLRNLKLADSRKKKIHRIGEFSFVNFQKKKMYIRKYFIKSKPIKVFDLRFLYYSAGIPVYRLKFF